MKSVQSPLPGSTGTYSPVGQVGIIISDRWSHVALDALAPCVCPPDQSFSRLKRRAFEMTETEERLIAAAAIMDESRRPITG